MGLKKNWDVFDIANQINALARECSSSYNDGFTSFEFKKDLYQIKNAIDHALKMAPDFGDMEKEWLTDQERKRIIKHLKS